jgi:predicted porin
LKKHLVNFGIACSALASVSAHAQNSVTLYGVVDTGFLWQSDPITGSGSKFSISGGGQGASIFGMIGREDLGGGLHAIFKLEGSFSSATGVSTLGGLFGRESWVGLDTPYGTVTAGLNYTPLYKQALLAGDAFDQFLVGYVGTLFSANPRGSNSIVYTSKNTYGFVVSAMYAFGNVAGDFKASREYSGSISYIRGPLRLNAAYYSQMDATGVNNSRSTLFSGSYDFGPAQMFSEFQMNRSDLNNAPGVSKQLTNDNAYSLGVRVPVSIHRLVAQVSYVTDERNVVNADGHTLFVAMGFYYNLSKQTNLYAAAGHTFNHGSTVFSTADNTAAAYGQTSVSFGLRHRF